MPQIRKSVLVPYSAQRMFELVADVPSYPVFMPWCGGASTQMEVDGDVRATIEIDFKGVRTAFTTLNRNLPSERIDMAFMQGPFSSLAGQWKFTVLGEGASKVEFALDYEIAGGLLGRAIGPVFEFISASFIDAFSARAEYLYG